MEQDGLNAIGFYNMVTSTTASAIGSANMPKYPNGDVSPRAMLVRPTTGDHNIRMDGVAPTSAATSGFPLLLGDLNGIWINGRGNIIGFQAATRSGAGALSIIFFG